MPYPYPETIRDIVLEIIRVEDMMDAPLEVLIPPQEEDEDYLEWLDALEDPTGSMSFDEISRL